jgi:hypothetical protein
VGACVIGSLVSSFDSHVCSACAVGCALVHTRLCVPVRTAMYHPRVRAYRACVCAHPGKSHPGFRAGRVKVSKVVKKNGSAHAWPDSNLSSTRMSGYAVGGQVFGVPEFRSWQKFPNTNPKKEAKSPDFYAQIDHN